MVDETVKFQKKYSRLLWESETEYVWRVSLTGGDQIMLPEAEAQRFWGPRMFLSVDDQRESWSLTQRSTYWTGDLDPLERGDSP